MVLSTGRKCVLAAAFDVPNIPYRGTALAVTDLLAGQVQVVFADPVSALPHIKAGTLLALAVTSKDRSPVAPDVPTVSESGYPGFDAIAWHGILAPANTPPCHRQQAQRRDRGGAERPGNQDALGTAGDADHRQFAGDLRRFHQAGYRNLEASGGSGQGGSQVNDRRDPRSSKDVCEFRERLHSPEITRTFGTRTISLPQGS
jgi:hypothetical protein